MTPAMTERRHLVTVCLTAGVAVLASAAPSPAATTLERWSPFTDSGALRSNLRVTPAFGGECWTGSFVVHDAFRCMARNFIYDPCWPDLADPDRVVCVRSPWDRNVIRMRVSGDMSDEYSAKPGSVWALRLESGARCTWAFGATTAVAGRRLNYSCTGGGYLFGSPDRRRNTWRIRFARTPEGAGMRKAAIRRAYTGTVS